MKLFIISLFSLLHFKISAQDIIKTKSFKPETDFKNIHVQKLSSDSLASAFAIWIKLKVKEHKHQFHTEHVYVINGKGNFTIADSTFKIKKGDFIIIPKNTFHSVNVTSKKTMKVISIQSPRFIGEDRVYKDLLPNKN